jgi:hypothetical protein
MTESLILRPEDKRLLDARLEALLLAEAQRLLDPSCFPRTGW